MHQYPEGRRKGTQFRPKPKKQRKTRGMNLKVRISAKRNSKMLLQLDDLAGVRRVNPIPQRKLVNQKKPGVAESQDRNRNYNPRGQRRTHLRIRKRTALQKKQTPRLGRNLKKGRAEHRQENLKLRRTAVLATLPAVRMTTIPNR